MSHYFIIIMFCCFTSNHHYLSFSDFFSADKFFVSNNQRVHKITKKSCFWILRWKKIDWRTPMLKMTSIILIFLSPPAEVSTFPKPQFPHFFRNVSTIFFCNFSAVFLHFFLKPPTSISPCDPGAIYGECHGFRWGFPLE